MTDATITVMAGLWNLPADLPPAVMLTKGLYAIALAILIASVVRGIFNK